MYRSCLRICRTEGNVMTCNSCQFNSYFDALFTASIGFSKSACKILHRISRWSLPYGQRIRPLEVLCRRSVKSSWSRRRSSVQNGKDLRHTMAYWDTAFFCPAISTQGTKGPGLYFVASPPKRIGWEQMALTIQHRYVMNLLSHLLWRHTTCARKHESQGSELSSAWHWIIASLPHCWRMCFAGPLCPRLPPLFFWFLLGLCFPNFLDLPGTLLDLARSCSFLPALASSDSSRVTQAAPRASAGRHS